MDTLDAMKIYLMKYRGVKYLLLCIFLVIYLFLDIYWVGIIPCFCFMFIQMLTAKPQQLEYNSKNKLDKTEGDSISLTELFFGSLLLAVLILNPLGFCLKIFYIDYLSNPTAISKFLQDYPLLASPVFWIVLPLAFLVGGGITVIITAFAKGNNKIILKFIFWMNIFEMPMIILQIYNLWKYYQLTNSFSITLEDNLPSILAFTLAIILFVYNTYKKKSRGETSLSYFIFKSSQFYLFVVSAISSLYFWLFLEIGK